MLEKGLANHLDTIPVPSYTEIRDLNQQGDGLVPGGFDGWRRGTGQAGLAPPVAYKGG